MIWLLMYPNLDDKCYFATYFALNIRSEIRYSFYCPLFIRTIAHPEDDFSSIGNIGVRKIAVVLRLKNRIRFSSILCFV